MMRKFPARRLFELALVLASVVPFGFVLWNNYAMARPDPSMALAVAVSFIVILNLIHVPATLYLYTDPLIRAQARAQPWKLILIPLLLIYFTTQLFYLFSAHANAAQAYGLFATIIFYLHWQSWHFGMQSYGVLSFVSLTSRRAKRMPFQIKAERALVMLGTIFGMMAIYHQLGQGLWFKHMPHIDYAPMARLGDVFYAVGALGCVLTCAAALYYLAAYRASFTPSAAIVFLISVGFFLPDYLTPFLPGSAMPNSLVSLVNFSLVHGIQYLVFLLAHVIGQMRQRHAAGKNFRCQLSTLMPLFYFLLLAVVLGALINNPDRLSGLASGILASLQIDIPIRRMLTACIGFSFGLTMAHFWVDQFIWKLSRPAQRDWVRQRYGYVMP